MPPSWRIFDSHTDRKRDITVAEAAALRQRAMPNPAALGRLIPGFKPRAQQQQQPGAGGSSTTLAVAGRQLIADAETPCNVFVTLIGSAAPVSVSQVHGVTTRSAAECQLPVLARRLVAESKRGESVDRLRQDFADLLQRRGIPKPREAFNRWLFEQRARRPRDAPTDPLIPNGATAADSPAVENELMVDAAEVYRDAEERRRVVQAVCQALAASATSRAAELNAALSRIADCSGRGSAVTRENAVTITAEVKATTGSPADDSAAPSSSSSVVVRHEMLLPHYRKLSELFRFHRDGRCTSSTVEPVTGSVKAMSKAESTEVEEAAAEQRQLQESLDVQIALLCERYRGAAGVKPNEGSGLHAAVPGEVMEVFRRRLGVTFEGFASPFNCYFRHFCSAFEDTDSSFGSCGSFFDLDFVEGGIEVNPPFVEEVMDPLADRMTEQLRRSSEAGKALTFVLVVPEWRRPPTPCIERIEANESGFLRSAVSIDREAHCYFDGFQHCLREAYFRPLHSTMVYVLQTERAAQLFPADAAYTAELAEVWKNCADRVKPNAFVEELKRKAAAAGDSTTQSQRREKRPAE